MKMYVINAKLAIPKAESSVGIQNKTVVRSLFPIRLAARNDTKSKAARIHTGEAVIMTKAPKPVAFCSQMPLNTDSQRITTRARKVAANPLRVIWT